MHQVHSHTQSSVNAIIQGYYGLIKPRVDKGGWNSFLLTFMFKPLNGSKQAIIAQMHDEVDRVFSTFITRIVRNPHFEHQKDNRPILFAAPDFPVFKKAKQALHDVSINDGLHMHGILTVPWQCRLRRGVKDQFEKDRALYVKNRLLNLDVRTIEDANLPEVVDYALKGLKRNAISYDDIMIFPRSSSEGRSKCIYENQPNKGIG